MLYLGKMGMGWIDSILWGNLSIVAVKKLTPNLLSPECPSHYAHQIKPSNSFNCNIGLRY